MIKKNFNKILFIINSLLLLILLVTYSVPMIHPSYLWQISLLGIIFPLVLALNIMFAIYWLFSWKKYFWANLIIILFGTSHIDNIIANQKNKLSSQELNDIKAGNQGTNFSSTEKEYEALLNLINNMNNKKYWLYAPGRNGIRWDEFYEQGVMGIGWDEIGDLSKLGDRNDIKEALKEKYEYTNNPMNHTLANHEFRDDIAIGDVIESFQEVEVKKTLK